MLFPPPDLRLHLPARVNRRIVKNDQRRSLHAPAVVIKAFDEGGAVDRPLKDVRLEGAVQVEKAQDVEPRRMFARDF